MPDPTTLPRLIRFGVFEVDLRSGELRKQGFKLKLTGQPFDVLAMLLERPGEIVTREELQKKLWPEGTFVDFDHSLNTAVNKIREVLGDSADTPRYVETVPRRGYRFIYPVSQVSSSLVAVAAVSPPPTETAVGDRRYSRRRITALAAGALLAIVAGLFALNVAGLRERILRRAEATIPAPPMRAVPFTSFPGQETHPSFSPDGNQIAFAWNGEKEDNWDIYVKVIGTESVLRLTTNPAVDRAPAWSPDGRHIAFHRHTESEDGIYLVPALGGPGRKLHSSQLGTYWVNEGLAWSPDGKYLAYVDRRPQQRGGIFFLEVENPDDRRSLTTPSAPYGGDYCPRYSPDGQTVAFIRHFTGGDAGDVYLVSGSGGQPKRLTSDNAWFHGLDWTPDGAYIVFSSSRLGGPRLWKAPASGGEPQPLSVGQEAAWFPSLSRDGHRLAYAQWSVDTNIWRYEIPQVPSHSAPPAKLIASTQWDLGQQFSPDGRRIVFSSNRSGSWEIWVCDADGSNPVQLTSFGGPETGTPRWSADGRQIAFSAGPEGHSDIYVVNAEGGRPRRLPTDTSNNGIPNWSRDGRWIYFASDRTGSWQVWKMPSQGGPAIQVTTKGGFASCESVDGKTLYYAKGLGVPGLWKVPVEGGEETSILEQLAAGYWGSWDLTTEGIYFYDASTKAIEFFSFATRIVTEILKPQKSPIALYPCFAVSHNNRWILYAQADQVASDIMLVENFRW